MLNRKPFEDLRGRADERLVLVDLRSCSGQTHRIDVSYTNTGMSGSGTTAPRPHTLPVDLPGRIERHYPQTRHRSTTLASLVSRPLRSPAAPPAIWPPRLPSSGKGSRALINCRNTAVWTILPSPSVGESLIQPSRAPQALR